MSTETIQSELDNEYRVVSVDKIDPPEGADGKNWHRYVISRSGSTIAGTRRGTVQQVTRHAEAFVDDLNARANGRSTSPWASSRKR